jgi:hypothetical protein
MQTGVSYGALPENAFRLNIHQVDKPSIGPGSYQPNGALLSEASPRATFGLAHRFLPSKVGYISPRHNSDLLCTASPGPKYNTAPTAATYPRQPALSWGERLTLEQREKKSHLITSDNSDVSPSSYTPRIALLKPTAPRCAFSRSSRFGGPFGSYQTLNNSAGGSSMYNPSDAAIQPTSPRYSFGAAHQNGLNEVRHKPRTSFMTHSIRGGLAKPATLECNIGPGDYAPHTGDIGDNNGSIRSGFGSSPRFQKGLYISAEHAKANAGQSGPGPKYLVAVGTTSYSGKTPRTSGLKWIP